MTLTDARKILGLEPDEDPCPHLAEFKNAREHIAAMVRTAPNASLADRYRKGLIEFDQRIPGHNPAEERADHLCVVDPHNERHQGAAKTRSMVARAGSPRSRRSWA